MGNMTWGPIALKVSTNDNDNPSPGGRLWREI